MFVIRNKITGRLLILEDTSEIDHDTYSNNPVINSNYELCDRPCGTIFVTNNKSIAEELVATGSTKRVDLGTVTINIGYGPA